MRGPTDAVLSDIFSFFFFFFFLPFYARFTFPFVSLICPLAHDPLQSGCTFQTSAIDSASSVSSCCCLVDTAREFFQVFLFYFISTKFQWNLFNSEIYFFFVVSLRASCLFDRSRRTICGVFFFLSSLPLDELNVKMFFNKLFFFFASSFWSLPFPTECPRSGLFLRHWSRSFFF